MAFYGESRTWMSIQIGFSIFAKLSTYSGDQNLINNAVFSTLGGYVRGCRSVEVTCCNTKLKKIIY